MCWVVKGCFGFFSPPTRTFKMFPRSWTNQIKKQNTRQAKHKERLLNLLKVGLDRLRRVFRRLRVDFGDLHANTRALLHLRATHPDIHTILPPDPRPDLGHTTTWHDGEHTERLRKSNETKNKKKTTKTKNDNTVPKSKLGTVKITSPWEQSHHPCSPPRGYALVPAVLLWAVPFLAMRGWGRGGGG